MKYVFWGSDDIIKKNKFNDVYEWIPIKNFDEDIFLKTGEVVKILEVKPINFALKSHLEQTAILESYKNFLKQCNFDIQIVVQTYKTNVDEHVDNIEKYSYGNKILSNMKESYIELVKSLISNRKSVTKRFFIIIKVDKNVEENVNKIISGLGSCGNEVIVCNENTIKEIFKNYFCKESIVWYEK